MHVESPVQRSLVDVVLNRGRVILTGLPGSGKTTAMAQLAAVWAADETGPLPLTVRATVILDALAKTRGKIYGSDGAAALLGLKPTTLSSRVHRMGLKNFVAERPLGVVRQG